MTLEQQDVQERLIDLRIRVKGLEMIVDALLSEREEPQKPQQKPQTAETEAIAMLERYVGVSGNWAIKRNADSLLIGFTHPVTHKWFQHLDWGEDGRAKLSVVITDAILAAQEKRNADA